MNLARFMAAFAAAGIVVATLLNALWSLYERAMPSIFHDPLLNCTLLLFPTSIGTIAIAGANYWSRDHFLLIAMNGLLYAMMGLLVWLGLHKHRAFLVLGVVLYLTLVVAVWTLR